VLDADAEHEFMRHIIAALADEARPDGTAPALWGEIIETSRNIPVRHIFGDHGFARDADGRWRRRLDNVPSQDRAVA
jgi:hypothetical protein